MQSDIPDHLLLLAGYSSSKSPPMIFPENMKAVHVVEGLQDAQVKLFFPEKFAIKRGRNRVMLDSTGETVFYVDSLKAEGYDMAANIKDCNNVEITCLPTTSLLPFMLVTPRP